jgi:molybdopterin biosynthesis enzyme
LGDTVRTGFPAPSGIDAVVPFRGPGGIPVVPTDVTVGYGHPLLNFANPSTCSTASEVVAHWVRQPPASVFVLANVNPLQYFPAPPRSCTLSSAIAIRPWAFAVLQGFPGYRRRVS